MNKEVLLNLLGITEEELKTLQTQQAKKTPKKVVVKDNFNLISLPDPYIIYRIELCKICKAKIVKIFHMRPNREHTALISVPISEGMLKQDEYKDLTIKRQLFATENCDWCELYLHTLAREDLIHMVMFFSSKERRI